MGRVSAPSAPCRIEAWVSVQPSEDPQKVLRALLNMLPECEVTGGGMFVKATSTDTASLDALRDAVISRQLQAGLRRNLLRNLDGEATWFYLNKQAAFVGAVAVCDDPEESPLGPLKITITSRRIQDIIEWLGGSA